VISGSEYRVLVVASGELRHDRNAGHQRLASIIEVLSELVERVGFFSIWLPEAYRYQCNVESIGGSLVPQDDLWLDADLADRSPRRLPLPETVARFVQALDESRPTHVWFNLRNAASELIHACRSVAPNSGIIYDAVDFEYLGRSLSSCGKRRVWVPGIRTAIIPILVERRFRSISRDSRSGMVFVGTAKHQPNVDAIRWYADSVVPHLGIGTPPLVVIGEDPDDLYSGFESEYVRAVGWLSDSDAAVERARVSIAPLTSGGGLRGKVLQAMACGTPVAGTTIAGRGIPNGDDLNKYPFSVLDGASFASTVESLLWDDDEWERVSSIGLELVVSFFGRESVADALTALLKSDT
jgi:glycosyltransferase involved in cell wall biosynthesis